MKESDTDPNQHLRRLHVFSALLIGGFIVLHIGNHIAMYWGQAAHREIMGLLRSVYRFPPFEIGLMAALVFQIVSGLRMAWRRWRTGAQGWIGRLQLISGMVLAAFIANHVTSVWVGRLSGLDTDYRFAAAGFHAGWAGFFIPYYFLGVVALFTHLACALWWNVPRRQRNGAFVAVTGIGIILGASFVGVMAQDVNIPAEYLASYR